jgi:HAD superfamily hydrolase (TIGR01509 family)
VPSETSGLRAVVFDLDGVLVDSEHLWEEMWARYAARHDTTWTAEHTSAVQGMSAPEWAAYLADVAGGAESAEQVEAAVVDEMVDALAAGRSPLLPGARVMVRDVSDRVPIALASSAPRRLIDAVLETHDLVADFTATVSSAEVPRGKPSPDVYLEAARRLATPPTECVGVEDSSNGIRAVHAAGMTVIAFPNPTYPPKPDALALADQVAADLEDVRSRLLALVASPTAAEDRR